MALPASLRVGRRSMNKCESCTTSVNARLHGCIKIPSTLSLREPASGRLRGAANTHPLDPASSFEVSCRSLMQGPRSSPTAPRQAGTPGAGDLARVTAADQVRMSSAERIREALVNRQRIMNDGSRLGRRGMLGMLDMGLAGCGVATSEPSAALDVDDRIDLSRVAGDPNCATWTSAG